MTRDLLRSDYVCTWADGAHTGARLGGGDRLFFLVMIGVRLGGIKEMVALSDGCRKSRESCAELLSDLQMHTLVLGMADGSLGFWAAVRDVFPEASWQRNKARRW